MLDTGIVRRIDELGRVVIPKEIRKNLSIKSGDCIEIYTSKEQIVLKKFKPKQYFTKETFNMLKSLAETTNKAVVFGNLEQVIYSVGLYKELKAGAISSKMKSVVEQDKNVVLNYGEVVDIEENSTLIYDKQAIMTLKDGEKNIYGFISLLSKGEEITSQDLNMLSLAVKTVEKNL